MTEPAAIPQAVYGHPPRDLAAVAPGYVQCSPLVPGATPLSDFAANACAALTVHAPASTIERRHVLALALRALLPGAPLVVLAANDKGGTRLAAELSSMGCAVQERHKHHHRIVETAKPQQLSGIDDAIAAGAPRLLPDLALWSQPGLFNWDRIDPGTQVLIDHLPADLKGRGADLGCGFGVLSRAVLARPGCRELTLIDIDKRAIEMASRNVTGEAVKLLWADVRTAVNLPTALDFVVMNPPFHDGGEEDRILGVTFIQRAASMLRPGGELWLTANRHLPYEAALEPLFGTVEQIAQAKGFKIYRAQKALHAQRAARARPTGPRERP